MRALVIAVLGALALAACDAPGVAPEAADPGAAPAPIPVRENVSVGTRITPAAFAGNLFRDACIKNRPGFAATPAVLARAGNFVRSAPTGTYFHQQFDLSFKVANGKCSMVLHAGNNAGARDTILDTAGSRTVISSGAPSVFNGKLYQSFFVSGGT